VTAVLAARRLAEVKAESHVTGPPKGLLHQCAIPVRGDPGVERTRFLGEAGVDVCFCLREGMNGVSGHTVAMSTNQFIVDQIAPYPERMYLEANCGPAMRRGMGHALWELEFLVGERSAKLCKVYAPEDVGPLDDRRMWPFYEKACELGITLTMHTGMSYVVPQPSSHTHPDTLDRVLLDFPELKVIAYHMGWPHTEELIGLAGKHINLHLSLSGIVGWYERSPYRGYHAIGTALQWIDPGKIVMGFDLTFDDMQRVVDWVRGLQIPPELQEKYGYPEITEEMRAGFLGLNLARLAGIEPTKRIE
jgi:predicted TIM-barrel fold metal-dependent hydrolase